MATLAINTAGSQTSIALLNDGGILNENSWQSANNEAEKLMPEIAALLKKENLTFSDLNKIFVVKGPGSFTGLRIGVTVANTIAYLNKSELFAADTLSFLWAAAPDSKENLALLVFAGRLGVYFSEKNQPPQIININELAEFLKKKKIQTVFGDITEEQKKFLGPARFTEITETFGRIAAKILTTGNLKSQKIIEPVYIKAPAISTAKKTIF